MDDNVLSLIHNLLNQDRAAAVFWADGGPLSLKADADMKMDSSLILEEIKKANPEVHDKVLFIIFLIDTLDRNAGVIKHVYRHGIRTIRGLVTYDISSALESPDPRYCLIVESKLFELDTSAFLSAERNIPSLDRFTKLIRTGISNFLCNQPNFDIRNTSVMTAATKPGAVSGADKQADQEVIDALCDIQRTLALASTLQEFRALLSSDLTSAFKIASMKVANLYFKTRHLLPGAGDDIRKVHSRAISILNRNQSALTALHNAMRGSGMAAVDGTYSRKDRLRIFGDVEGNMVKNINLEELFGDMDSDPCDDCNSVTSRAAYFVDILQFLRNNNLDPEYGITKHEDEKTKEMDQFAKAEDPITKADPPALTVLEHLFARRPDLGNLQLTCPNTTAILPYIDLANEVMESFVIHLGKHTIDNDGAITQAKVDVNNCSGYGEMVSEPQHTNFDAYSILSRQLYAFHKLPYNQGLDEVRIFLKHLGTSRYELLETFFPSPGTSTYTEAMVAEYLNFTHEEYVALTGGAKIKSECEYWGYEDNQAPPKTQGTTCTGLQFIQAQFLPRSGIQFSDLADLLKTEFINPMTSFEDGKAIVISHYGEQDMRFRLVHSNGCELNDYHYSRIRKFIHLWQRIGWTIDETDKAICGISRFSDLRASVLIQLVSILQLLEITKLERSMLLTFWSPISMQGADSLYSQLFRTSGATRLDPVLNLDENGGFLASAKISKHETLVMSTLGLTKEGLDAIKAELNNDELSIANLSFLYRHSLMAGFLGVTPTVLLEVIKTFENPFDTPINCLKFVNRWKRMGAIGFTFAQLKYVVYAKDDRVKPLALAEKRMQETILSLVAGTTEDPNITGTTMRESARNEKGKKLETDLLITTLSQALGLPIDTLTVLLPKFEIDGKKALEIGLSITSLEKEQASQASILLVNQLSRAAVLIAGFKLSAAEVSWALDQVSGFKEFHGQLLGVWNSLLAYSEFRDSLPKGVDGTFLDLLKWVPAENTAAEEQAQRIANLMLVPEGMVRKLMMNFGSTSNKSYKDITVWTKLKKACDLANKVAIDVGSLLSWASPLGDFEHTHKVAQAIRASIRARFTQKNWGKIVKPLEDQLRKNQRDALIAYLLVQPILIKWGVVDKDSLFEFFLIDVQMGPCFETSRITQAISTVQVFVQRCFSGLEERHGVSNHRLDQKRWEWMKNYRMWKANRKVFLYPENWVEPSLRDDKSPFFLEFEADLAKKELDSKCMQDAVKNYISRVDEISNLFPVTLLAETTIVHLFAWTRSTPYVYYYRSYDQKRNQWKPWEKMDVEIQYHEDPDAVGQGGAFLIPAMIAGRLIVFTPQIVKQVKKKEVVDKKSPPEILHYFEIKLGWSEYRNGKWTPKQLSSEALRSKSQATLDHPVRMLKFSLANPTITAAEIVVDQIGTFKFKDGYCTAKDKEGKPIWVGTDEYQFNKTKIKDMSLIAKSSIWSVSDSQPCLHLQNLDKPEVLIPLTDGACTGLLTQTSASATLDQIFTYLHTIIGDIALNELESPLGIYDWELGLHAPMLLIDKLTRSQQYDKALEIARFVFNPMASDAKDPSPLRVWKWAPFRKTSLQKSFQNILRSLRPNEFNTEVSNWRNTPFQPHVVARDRPVTYMKWMVMRYLKILIAAGDQLFRLGTMESMPLALQYYTTAAHLCAPPIPEIPKHTKTTPKTFNTLIEKWDAFSNAMVSFENAFPFTTRMGNTGGRTDAGFSLGYFCVPRNPEITDLRTQIDNHLYKIRNSLDINGFTSRPALLAPPIDPRALVHATAAGLSISSVLNSISGPMPNYRFQYLLRGALEMVQELKSLAGSFLSAKEKMDSEAYQWIRIGHESTSNAMVLDMKKMSRDEANRAIESLRKSREGSVIRLNHFLQLVGQDIIKSPSTEFTPVDCDIEKPTGSLMTNTSEKLETTLAHAAAGLRAGGTGLAGISELTRVIPTPEIKTAPMGVGMSLKAGPKNVARDIRAASLTMEVTGQVTQHLADSAARTNMCTRQYQDRVLQANSAGFELNSINAQIKIQEVRVSIVEKDIKLQEKQIETAKATEEFLHSKYTNKALYSWQENNLHTLHNETYILAYDLAKKVEKSYQFERGVTENTTNFIVSTWDSSRDGLLSAEGLGLGLRRLESAYQESRGHDFEITKHISLRQINPKALLKLRSTNSCEFSLPETLFDMDFPGHHTRRLKSVSLSLPCVVGPYTSVNCTLELTKHSYRLGAGGDPTEQQVNYVPIHSVAFSSAQNDPGVFELNFHDERYLPFEGAGVISSWRLSLPKFSAFDYQTISDVILHLRYTSIAGADTTASTRLKGHLAAGKTVGSEIEGALYASFDLRNEFASTWQQLRSGQPMTLSNLNARLPWWTTKHKIEVVEVQLQTSTVANLFTPSEGNPGFVFQIKSDTEEAKGTKEGGLIDGITTFTIDTGITTFGTWKLTMAKQEFSLTDLWMVVQYKAMIK